VGTTLGQIVGIHKSTRVSIQREWDEMYHLLQKGELFSGFDKTHTPFEGNLPQPAQSKRVQANATELVTGLEKLLSRLFDLEATKDNADTEARADLVVGDDTLMTQVPVNHLLWMEKQVANLVTVFNAIPVMTAAEDWQPSQALDRGMYRTQAERTPSTKKDTHWEVVVPAIDNGDHGAIVKEVSNDIQSGTWEIVKYTAAMRPTDKALLIKRASVLLDAIRFATTTANHLPVTDIDEGEKIFGYLFDGMFNV
jgi:hypothetical protein